MLGSTTIRLRLVRGLPTVLTLQVILMLAVALLMSGL